MTTLLSRLFGRKPDLPKNQLEQNELEQYITSKKPTTVAEVEHWTREFDRHKNTLGWMGFKL